MDIRIQTLNCERCGKQHQIEVDFDTLTKGQLAGQEPILDNFVCPDMAVMYRVSSYALDTRVNIFKGPAPEDAVASITRSLKMQWGEHDFENKLQRFKDLDLWFLGVPEEYYELLMQIISTYCSGYFYPAITSAGALGERILNRLILKTRDYFQSSPHYKNVYRSDSFDRWEKVIPIIKEWGIISDDVAELFNQLKVYRNDSIHYNEGYDFDSNSHKAIKILAEIIDKQFNYMKRKDLFWVFIVPGEIWLKTEVEDSPFVKEFVLPHCLLLTAYDEPNANPPVKANNVPLKPILDEDFLNLRKKYQGR